MPFIADLHIHSRYSRATSSELDLSHIELFARRKGIRVIGTGDFTHPLWRKELREKLTESEPGLFRLKPEYKIKDFSGRDSEEVSFLISGEISTIYKKAGKIRKLHHLVLVPDFESAEKLCQSLGRLGNLEADGRPILGIDSKDLLEMVLESSDGAVLIPAHIWTPWFSLFGSNSGFDYIEECFEELEGYIFALETGLSSDPPMNWRLSSLDRFSLVSNSDAHSPSNLGREANIFNCELDYFEMLSALREPEKGFLGTVEFFPQEGKYHYDGHRKCGVCWSPRESIAHNKICNVCAKPVTIGVMHRVEELSDREKPEKPNRAPGYHSLIPLNEILAEIFEVQPSSKKVSLEYARVLEKLGAELKVLLDAPLDEIACFSPILKEAIKRMREGKVIVREGYDGEYGVIRLFEKGELKELYGQKGFFQDVSKRSKEVLFDEDSSLFQIKPCLLVEEKKEKKSSLDILEGLDESQLRAVVSASRFVVVKAGPGTGKTRTLTSRIAYLVKERGVEPERVLAIAFTNHSSEEMRNRLRVLLGEELERRLTVSTFHSFGYRLILEDKKSLFKDKPLIIGEREKLWIIEEIKPSGLKESAERISRLISDFKINLVPVSVGYEKLFLRYERIFYDYCSFLLKNSLVDLDDLIYLPTLRMLRDFRYREEISSLYPFIFVDEYQDLNFAEYKFLNQLVCKDSHLFVIGDPNQAIYGFRGASREFFLNFQKDYPSCETISLEKSYRLTSQILKATEDIMDDKTIKPRSERSGALVRISELPSENAEAEFILSEIERLLGGTGFFSMDSRRVESSEEPKGIGFKDIAILVRTSIQVEPLVFALERSGVPFQDLTRFPFENKFFSLAISLFKLSSEPENKIIMKMTLGKLFETIKDIAYKDILNLESEGFEKKERERFELLKFIFKNVSGNSLLTEELVEKIFQLIPERLQEEREEKLKAKQMIVDYALRFRGTVSQFLNEVQTASAQDFYDPKADRISVMTIHSAKGLEFDVVFIPGCEDGIIPLEFACDDEEKKEEQRLFYVGMTRARRIVYLTRAKRRLWRGKIREFSPSPYLFQINGSVLEELSLPKRRKRPQKSQLEMF